MHSSALNGNHSVKTMIGYVGVLWIILGTVILMPLPAIVFFPEESECAKYFIFPGVSTILIGYILKKLMLSEINPPRLKKNDDAVIVVITWISAILIGSIPFMLTGDYSFSQSVFETTSGFSTTGLSVVDVENAPKIFLIYRSVMLFFGGIGLVLVMTSVLSDVYSMRLYSAEGHSDRLTPNLLRSARTIITIYTGYIIAGIVLYIICGMNFFDAFNHSIAALSTGGFSTRAASIGYYDSVSIELVTEILMLLGCTNFFVHLLLLKGHFKSVFRHCEVRLMLLLTALCTPIALFIISGHGAANMSRAARDALFQVVSALTTTGFQTVPSFKNMPSPLSFMLIILMLIGGGAGSTAGGIKQFRVWIMLKELWWDLVARFGDSRVVRVNQVERFGKKEIADLGYLQNVNIFIFAYIMIFLCGSFIFMLCGYSISDSMFEFASALGTVGLSVGITCAGASPLVLWTAVAGMFFGRLEMYVILLSIIKVKDNVKTLCRR